ncbi:alpha/beta fold hydrolase [Paeniglutamicibacter antarcticus]|uniref:Alpha/beta fold hydrolase n=1 Tax=Arthrobacter terrae TaxID=2935737 RepID=A0A931CWY3_9MICC|nr:alpha/beta fold hydrolase [Arthrobacter terrae]MBG0741458.1 alpha/beta fold hydrolase [Arthrobacter terrae]
MSTTISADPGIPIPDAADLPSSTSVPSTAPLLGSSAVERGFMLRRRIFPTELGPVAVRYSPATADGDGRKVTADVYLHGAAGSWTTFVPLLAASERRAAAGTVQVTRTAQVTGTALAADPAATTPSVAGRPMVYLDLPGWGESDLRADISALTIEAMSDVVTGILATLGYRRWNLIGHSMGGFLALHIAAVEPLRTSSVAVLSGTTFSVARSAGRPFVGLLRSPAFTGMLLVMRTMAGCGAAGEFLIRRTGNSALMKVLMAPFFAYPHSIDPSVITALGQDARPASFAAAARAAAGYDFTRWRSITAPVLATRGDQDVFTPPSDLARLAELVPHAELFTIADCGHFAPIEHPDLVDGMLTRLAGETELNMLRNGLVDMA